MGLMVLLLLTKINKPSGLDLVSLRQTTAPSNNTYILPALTLIQEITVEERIYGQIWTNSTTLSL